MDTNPSPRRVLVTGASSGIGADCAAHFLREGWEVCATYRQPDACARARAAGIRAFPLDLQTGPTSQVGREGVDGSAAPVEAMGEAFRRDTGGGLDALVHAAGYVQPGLLAWITPEQLRRQLEVNTVGAHAVLRALLPDLAARRGRVVWISSVSGRVSLPGIGAYAASKFALEALADAWRIELADAGVGLTLVEPGPVETPIWDKADRLLAECAGPADPVVRAAMHRELRAAQSAAVPVGRVTEAVARAVSRRTGRPPARIVVTRPGPRWLLRVLGVLPDGVRDLLVRFQYRAALQPVGKR